MYNTMFLILLQILLADVHGFLDGKCHIAFHITNTNLILCSRKSAY